MTPPETGRFLSVKQMPLSLAMVLLLFVAVPIWAMITLPMPWEIYRRLGTIPAVLVATTYWVVPLFISFCLVSKSFWMLPAFVVECISLIALITFYYAPGNPTQDLLLSSCIFIMVFLGLGIINRDASAGSYFCNTTLLAFSNQDLGRPTALTGNVELPAQGGGQAVFGHFKADQSEYDARANDVIAATDSVLGGPVNRPTGQIANAPQAINETPQGTAAPTQAPATQAPPANTASAPSSTPAPAPAGQPAPAPTGTALH